MCYLIFNFFINFRYIFGAWVLKEEEVKVRWASSRMVLGELLPRRWGEVWEKDSEKARLRIHAKEIKG